jgi:hypothetical protein
MRLPSLSPWRRAAAVAATFACAPPAALHAQEATPAPASAPSFASPASLLGLPGTVDAGASAGLARTGRWYDAGGEPGTVEGGTALSAEVRYWPVAWLGLRLQAGRFDGRIRTAFRPAAAGGSPPQELSGTVYDASVVVRPLAAARISGPLSAAYVFAGGGGTTLHLSGTPDTLRVCSEDGDVVPECLVSPASGGTVQQATAGAGTDVLRVAGFTVFVEASLHRYRPPFTHRGQDASGSAGPAFSADPRPLPAVLAPPDDFATTGAVVTRRLAAGVRRTFGGRPATHVPPPPPPPPPPPAAPATPPPSPTTGGVVTVATVEPGAEVYLVPRTALEDDPGLRCRLRPVLAPGSYFAGRTTGAQPLRVPAGPRAWVLVVRQQVASGGRRIWHVHEQRIRMAGGNVLPVRLNMQRDGRPPQPCPP